MHRILKKDGLCFVNLMSTDYRLDKTVQMSELFDGRLQDYDIEEAIVDGSTTKNMFLGNSAGNFTMTHAAGAEVKYEGTIPSNVLKVIGKDLTSIGQINKKHVDETEIVSHKPQTNDYIKIVLKNKQIFGAIIFGNNRLGCRTVHGIFLLQPDFL